MSNKVLVDVEHLRELLKYWAKLGLLEKNGVSQWEHYEEVLIGDGSYSSCEDWESEFDKSTDSELLAYLNVFNIN